jgi:drug/metabolite transporter (DMT)-like permease
VDRRSWTLLLALSAIWGASYLLIKIGLRDLSPELVAFTRIALAALLLLPIAASRGALGVLRGRLGWIVVLGAVQVAGPFLLIAAGEGSISSSLAGILVATTPILTALLALRLDREERSEGMRLLGVGIGIAGVVALFGLDLTGSGSAMLGGLAVILASLGYSIGGFIVKARLADVPPIGIVTGVMAAGSLLLLPAAAATLPSTAPSAGPLAAVVALGLLGTGVAFVLFYALIAKVGPARTMLVSYIAPGFAVVYGAWFLSEPITAGKVIGLALVLAGSWLGVGGRVRPSVAVEEAATAPQTGYADSEPATAARRSAGATR